MRSVKLSDILQGNGDLDIVVNVGDEDVKLNIAEELMFGFSTLNEDLTDHAAKASYISALLEQFQTALEIEEQELAIQKAEMWLTVKNDSYDVGGKPLSDARVDMVVRSNVDINKKEKQVFELRSHVRRLNQIMNLFRQRKDLMQSYASNLRTTV